MAESRFVTFSRAGFQHRLQSRPGPDEEYDMRHFLRVVFFILSSSTLWSGCVDGTASVSGLTSKSQTSTSQPPSFNTVGSAQATLTNAAGYQMSVQVAGKGEAILSGGGYVMKAQVIR